MVMVTAVPDIYRLKFRLWTDFVKRNGCLPPPEVWSEIGAEIRTKINSRAGKERTEQVKKLTSDKENVPLSEFANEPVVFKIPVSSPRQHRRQTITITVQRSNENNSVTENISAKENISVVENILAKDSEIISSRHLPGSVTVACVTACEKSSNPSLKVSGT